MKARSRGERLLLLKRKIMPDRQGGYQEEWKELGTYWASLKSCSTNPFSKSFIEGCKAGAMPLKSHSYKVETYIDCPKEFERFQWRGRIFAVVSPIEEQHKEKTLSFYAVSLETLDQNPHQEDEENV